MTEIGQSALLYIAGSPHSFRCECGTNVFTRTEDYRGEQVYQCNGCLTEYASPS